jgi:hypothetical protein
MIHDATGKFSSRWVFPDRSWFAVGIGIGYADLDRNWVSRQFPNAGQAGLLAHPYRGNRELNQCYLSPFSHNQPATAATRRRPDNEFAWFSAAIYWPWFSKTWLQAFVNFTRFSCRQARIVKSP